jgi:Mlc titration factor MtfA (ptsG expression regulator)
MLLLLPFLIILIVGLLIFKLNRKNEKKWITPTDAFPVEWRDLLHKEIPYYRSLTEVEKSKFEFKVHEFLSNCKVSGIKTNVTEFDKILVASSAIIPIFGFSDWKYNNLQEVLIYPTLFNSEFETDGKGRSIQGMVGTGYMDGHMILSQQALKHGFKNTTDKKNTAIHEFVHLIDKKDGPIDGLPSALMEREYAIPWLEFINKKMDEIYEGESDINPYGGTNQAEFFSVASEYFFERPKLLQKKHPELYDHLEKFFRQDMASRNLSKPIVPIKRNSPCICGSKVEYKKCCGNGQKL